MGLIGNTNKGERVVVRNGIAPNPMAFWTGGVAVVGGGNTEKQDDKKCPRCKKITVEELQKVFTDIQDKSRLAKAQPFFQKAFKAFHIDTCQIKAHFFAQVLAEVGKGWTETKGESMNYSSRRLITGYEYREGKASDWVKGDAARNMGGYYSTGPVSSYAKSPFRKERIPENIAEKYGRKDLNTYGDGRVQAADEKHLAIWIYADSHKANGEPANENGWNYRGKGLLQVTWKEGYTNAQNAINARYQGATKILEHPKVIDGSDEYAIIAGCADWYASELFTPADKGKTQVAVDGVTHIVNSKTDSKTKRWEFFRDITSPTFRVAECSRGKSAFEATDGIVTYHIDSGFSIEKHIPKRIKQGYEKKYKYVYHDGDGKEHEVCTLDWTEIDKMKYVKEKITTIPNDHINDESFNINGVNQKHVYTYSDGSVIATGGAGEGGGSIKHKYVKSDGTAVIVRIPDDLGYNSGEVKINLTFKDTIRKYMNCDFFAGLVGALAECGFSSVVSGGAAMKDGTCFPSVSHTNGSSIDFAYFSHDNTQKFIDAMVEFGFCYFLYGVGMKFKKPLNKDVKIEGGHADHNGHLHCGAPDGHGFKLEIITINEK